MHVVIKRIINLEKQEVALGNQNVRALSLPEGQAGIQVFLFFSFFSSPVISEQSINFVLFL